MKTFPGLLFGAAALIVSLVGATQACSSATQGLDGQGGTGITQGTGGGTSGTGTSGTGTSGSTGDLTCADPNNLDRTCTGPNPDTATNCNTTNASTGEACTIDCRVECGFEGIGLKICTCTNGTYESCPCARPAAYKGLLTASLCATPGELADPLDETPCTTEWDQCIGRDPVTGDTPRGCACMKQASGELLWSCGSSNNWFTLPGAMLNACTMEPPADTCAGVNPDTSCSSANAKTGAVCTKDCQVGCGYQRLGLKYCTCLNGAYSACPCPKPEGWMGADTAPRCATPDGTTTALDEQPCTTEWEECIGTDPVTGSTPQGCACLKNATSGAMRWYCGSTNRWFAPQ